MNYPKEIETVRVEIARLAGITLAEKGICSFVECLGLCREGGG